jgi:hypothetical protein
MPPTLWRMRSGKADKPLKRDGCAPGFRAPDNKKRASSRSFFISSRISNNKAINSLS